MSGRLAIDFGTSNTVLAVWSEEQQIGITHHIPDYGQLYTQGDRKVSLIPSLIHYDSNQRRWLGNQVLQRNLEKSDRTFRWIKRYIANRSPVKRRIDSRQIPYTEAGQDFLSTVLLFATTELNITDEEIAFTVPVESFEHYEAWLGEVAAKAGIRRFRLIDEPSAAALGYGAHIQPGDVYLIFDFGGGTLDVAVVLIETEEESQSGRRCRVLGKSGVDLGGTNLDQLLFLEVLNQSGYTDSDETIRRLSGALLVECEQAKIRLSSRDRAEISVLDPNTGTVLGADISRSRFEELMDENEVFAQLDQTIRRSLNQARERGYQEENIKSVLLVGGSSQIPSIQRTIRQIFGKDRVLLDRPLDAVARGAAAFISGIDFYDHIQHDYAIRFYNRQTQKYDYKTLVPRGTPYPTIGAIANLTIKATYEGQERLGMALFEVSEARRRSNSVELVFDPSGAARMVDVSPDEEERRTYFWLNEDSPTFLQTKTSAKSGDPCFRVEFSIDDNKRLLMTTRDLKTLQITHKDYPVVKLT